MRATCWCCHAVEKRRFAFPPFDKKIILSSPNTPCQYFTVSIVLQNGPLHRCKPPAPRKWQTQGGYRAIRASRDLCSLAKKFNQKQHKFSSIVSATRINNYVLLLIVLELDILFSSLFAILVTWKEIWRFRGLVFNRQGNKPISAQDFYSTELYSQIRCSEELATCRKESGKNQNH